MLDWALGGLNDLLGFAGNAVSSAVGWAWDKVISGIYTWLAKGLALLIQWVWGVLDTATTPRLGEAWFAKTLMGRVGLVALAVTIAMMLASAIQAALAGRPEQITDTVKEGVRAIVASALTVSVVTILIGITDEVAASVWQIGRADMVTMLDRMVTVTMTTGPLGQTFIGPLCLLFGYLGLLGLAVALFMRNALIYLTAALAPIVWSTSVLPLLRGSSRKLVHLTVALIVSKLAIVITLVVAVKLIANTGGDPATHDALKDGATAVGMLVSGFVCFLIAAITPVVLYKLMPTVEGAAVASGIAGGWTRSATTVGHSALMAKSFGASAATRPLSNSVGAGATSGAAGGGSGTAGVGAGSAGAAAGSGESSAAGGPAALAVGSLATGGNPPTRSGLAAGTLNPDTPTSADVPAATGGSSDRPQGDSSCATAATTPTTPPVSPRPATIPPPPSSSRPSVPPSVPPTTPHTTSRPTDARRATRDERPESR
jgi:hypothetical protein